MESSVSKSIISGAFRTGAQDVKALCWSAIPFPVRVKNPLQRASPTKRRRHDSLQSSSSNEKRKVCCHLLMGHSSRTVRRRAEGSHSGIERSPYDENF